MPKLIYHDSDGVEKVINLGADPITIGRANECDIQTQDAMVSRRHARIVWDGGYWIEDLGSSNGVYIGHEKVKRAAVRPGDTVTCGSLVLRLMPDATPRTATPAASPALAASGAPPPPAPPPPAAAAMEGLDVTLDANALREVAARAVAAADQRIAAAAAGRAPAAPVAAGGDRALAAVEERARVAEARVAELEPAAREASLLKRKLEQLTVDLKRARQGLPGAADDGDRQARLFAEAERDQLRERVVELEREKAGASPAPRAGAPDPALSDLATQLSDALAELRGSLRAASGEAVLLKEPTESVEVVREALKAAAEQLESARTHLRAMAKLL